MRTLCYWTRTFAIALVAASLGSNADAAVTLPSSATLPTNSVSNPGFVVRTAQASTNYVVANNFNRALRQINGLLTDSGGATITNIAIPGTNSLGAYHTDYVDFEKDGFPVDIRDTDGIILFGQFASELFPGIPGEEFETTQFATEVIALVVLTAGTHSWPSARQPTARTSTMTMATACSSGRTRGTHSRPGSPSFNALARWHSRAINTSRT